MFYNPLLPDLKDKSLDELSKEMNDLYVKLRMFSRQENLYNQVLAAIHHYKEEYDRRINEEVEKEKEKREKIKQSRNKK